MKKKFLPLSIAVVGIVVVFGILLAQGVVWGFGFEKNIDVRKSADAESVAGCMQSCQDMLTGWLEMNPESKNYINQKEKIEAKAEQCLAMNELAGFHYSEEDILRSCGLWPTGCALVSPRDISFGSCTTISFIEETNVPQCCGFEGPQGGINCGVDEEWVVGIAAVPTCYIPNS